MKTTERWIYAGRRLSGKGKLYGAWYEPTSERTMWFPKTNGVIGSAYDAEIERDGEKTTLYGSPVFATSDADVDADLVRGWKAEDADAYHEIETKRAEKRAAADDEVERALDVLRSHFDSCKTYSAKWGFAQWVAAEVARPARGDR